MAQTATPHITPHGAPVAQTVLLPGDPLRAKFIAETFLEDVVQFNAVRNMLGYTGTFRGRELSAEERQTGFARMIELAATVTEL